MAKTQEEIDALLNSYLGKVSNEKKDPATQSSDILRRYAAQKGLPQTQAKVNEDNPALSYYLQSRRNSPTFAGDASKYATRSANLGDAGRNLLASAISTIGKVPAASIEESAQLKKAGEEGILGPPDPLQAVADLSVAVFGEDTVIRATQSFRKKMDSWALQIKGAPADVDDLLFKADSGTLTEQDAQRLYGWMPKQYTEEFMSGDLVNKAFAWGDNTASDSIGYWLTSGADIAGKAIPLVMASKYAAKKLAAHAATQAGKLFAMSAGGITAGSIASGLMEGALTYDQRVNEGIDPVQAAKEAKSVAMMSAGITAATSGIGIWGLGGKGGSLMRLFRASTEPGEESLQQVSSNYITGRPLSEGVAESALLSGPMGLFEVKVADQTFAGTLDRARKFDAAIEKAKATIAKGEMANRAADDVQAEREYQKWKAPLMDAADLGLDPQEIIQLSQRTKKTPEQIVEDVKAIGLKDVVKETKEEGATLEGLNKKKITKAAQKITPSKEVKEYLDKLEAGEKSTLVLGEETKTFKPTDVSKIEQIPVDEVPGDDGVIRKGYSSLGDEGYVPFIANLAKIVNGGLYQRKAVLFDALRSGEKLSESQLGEIQEYTAFRFSMLSDGDKVQVLANVTGMSPAEASNVVALDEAKPGTSQGVLQNVLSPKPTPVDPRVKAFEDNGGVAGQLYDTNKNIEVKGQRANYAENLQLNTELQEKQQGKKTLQDMLRTNPTRPDETREGIPPGETVTDSEREASKKLEVATMSTADLRKEARKFKLGLPSRTGREKLQDKVIRARKAVDKFTKDYNSDISAIKDIEGARDIARGLIISLRAKGAGKGKYKSLADLQLDIAARMGDMGISMKRPSGVPPVNQSAVKEPAAATEEIREPSGNIDDLEERLRKRTGEARNKQDANTTDLEERLKQRTSKSPPVAEPAATEAPAPKTDQAAPVAQEEPKVLVAEEGVSGKNLGGFKGVNTAEDFVKALDLVKLENNKRKVNRIKTDLEREINRLPSGDTKNRLIQHLNTIKDNDAIGSSITEPKKRIAGIREDTADDITWEQIPDKIAARNANSEDDSAESKIANRRITAQIARLIQPEDKKVLTAIRKDMGLDIDDALVVYGAYKSGNEGQFQSAIANTLSKRWGKNFFEAAKGKAGEGLSHSQAVQKIFGDVKKTIEKALGMDSSQQIVFEGQADDTEAEPLPPTQGRRATPAREAARDKLDAEVSDIVEEVATKKEITNQPQTLDEVESIITFALSSPANFNLSRRNFKQMLPSDSPFNTGTDAEVREVFELMADTGSKNIKRAREAENELKQFAVHINDNIVDWTKPLEQKSLENRVIAVKKSAPLVDITLLRKAVFSQNVLGVPIDLDKMLNRQGKNDGGKSDEIAAAVTEDLLSITEKSDDVISLASTVPLDFQGPAKGSTLVGKIVRDVTDLATAAQIWRDPRFETLRYAVVKKVEGGWKVLHVKSITNRSPDSVAPYIYVGGEKIQEAYNNGEITGEEYVLQVNALARANREMFENEIADLGGDGYFAIHNHPNGDARPSAADLTLSMASITSDSKYLGEVIIDSGEFAYLSKDNIPDLFNEVSGLNPQDADVKLYESSALFVKSLPGGVDSPQLQLTQFSKPLENQRLESIAQSISNNDDWPIERSRKFIFTVADMNGEAGGSVHDMMQRYIGDESIKDERDFAQLAMYINRPPNLTLLTFTDNFGTVLGFSEIPTDILKDRTRFIKAVETETLRQGAVNVYASIVDMDGTLDTSSLFNNWHFASIDGWSLTTQNGETGEIETDGSMKSRGPDRRFAKSMSGDRPGRKTATDWPFMARAFGGVRAKTQPTTGNASIEVMEAAGWFKGADGKWRFEISDKNTKLLDTFDMMQESSIFGDTFTKDLDEILYHPDLFEAYPELRDVKIIRRRGLTDFLKRLQGVFDIKNNTINITPYAKDPHATLMHEIQHWIQFKENFAVGGNEDSVLAHISNRDKIEIGSNIVEILTMEAEEILELRRLYDEMKSKYGDRLFGKGKLEYIKENYDARVEVEKEIFGVDDNGNTLGSVFWSLSVKSYALQDIWYGREAPDTSKAVALQQRIAALKSGDVKTLESEMKKSGSLFKFYQNLAGEVEARDVASRIGLTMEERLALPAASKITRDQIVVFGDPNSLASMMSVAPPSKSKHIMSAPVSDKAKGRMETGRTHDPSEGFVALMKSLWKDGTLAFHTVFKGMDRRDPLNTKAINATRKLMGGGNTASFRAGKELAGVIENLDTEQRNLMGFTLAFRDLNEELKNDKLVFAIDEDGEETTVFGLTRDEVVKGGLYFEEQSRKDLMISAALSDRRDMLDKIRKQVSEAWLAAGVNVDSNFTKDEYFRHQVIEYAKMSNILGRGSLFSTPRRQSIFKQRGGSTKDFSLNYIMAEFEVLNKLLYSEQVANFVSDMDRSYSKKVELELRADAKAAGLPEFLWPTMLKAKYPDWEVWQPDKGKLFFFSEQIQGNIAHESMIDTLTDPAIMEGLADGSVTKEQIELAIAYATKKNFLVLPKQIVQSLNKLNEISKESKYVAAYRQYVERFSKRVILLGPGGLFKYTLRNISGDLDALMTGNHRLFTSEEGRDSLGEAWTDIGDVFRRGKIPSEKFERFLESGAFRSLFSVAETDSPISIIQEFTPDFKSSIGLKDTLLKAFSDPVSMVKNTPKALVKGADLYLNKAQKMNDARELYFRYAAFLHFLKQIERNGGVPDTYAASMKHEVDGLDSYDDKAFKLANDLLGAYDELSDGGQGMRKSLFWFFSWTETNLRRYKNMWVNSLNEGDLAGFFGRALLGKALKTPYFLMKAGKFAIKANIFAYSVQAFSRLLFGEDDDLLPENVRRRLHLTFGRMGGALGENTIAYFTRLGAFEDVLEWVGMEDLRMDVEDFANGRKSLKDWAIETVFKSPVNKVVQMVRPDLKGAFELSLGATGYPDIFNSSEIRDRYQYIARLLHVDEITAAFRGLPQKGGDNNLANMGHALTNLFVYTADPREADYHALYNRMNRFLKERGESTSGRYGEKSKLLYNLRMAMRYGDTSAMNKYFTDYLIYSGDKGLYKRGSLEGVRTSLQGMAPFAGMKASYAAEFRAEAAKDPEIQKEIDGAQAFYEEVLADPGGLEDLFAIGMDVIRKHVPLRVDNKVRRQYGLPEEEDIAGEVRRSLTDVQLDLAEGRVGDARKRFAGLQRMLGKMTPSERAVVEPTGEENRAIRSRVKQKARDNIRKRMGQILMNQR